MRSGLMYLFRSCSAPNCCWGQLQIRHSRLIKVMPYYCYNYIFFIIMFYTYYTYTLPFLYNDADVTECIFYFILLLLLLYNIYFIILNYRFCMTMLMLRSATYWISGSADRRVTSGADSLRVIVPTNSEFWSKRSSNLIITCESYQWGLMLETLMNGTQITVIASHDTTTSNHYYTYNYLTKPH